MIVIENVTGLLTSHGGKDFDAICDALADAGYRFGAVVIDAALFVPQSRERVFIIGVDADAHIPAELVADGPMAPFHPPALVAACQRQRRIRSGGAFQSRRREIRSWPTSSRTNRRASPGTLKPRPSGSSG